MAFPMDAGPFVELASIDFILMVALVALRYQTDCRLISFDSMQRQVCMIYDR